MNKEDKGTNNETYCRGILNFERDLLVPYFRSPLRFHVFSNYLNLFAFNT